MSTATTTDLRSLLNAALAACERGCAGHTDTYSLAAATGLLLAYVEQHELCFHPSDCADFSADPEVEGLLNACPELDQAWRQLMAAKQLASVIATALEKGRAKATNGLVAIASASEKTSHFENDGLVDADFLEELACIATGKA